MIKIGNREFDTKHRSYIMGILNITPDSFSDGGMYNTCDAALKRVEQMIDEGADLIDIGGESSRPGYQKVSVQQELDRIAPVIEQIKCKFDIPISLDTYKSEVAKAGIALGVDLINDIWGLKDDSEMAKVIADSGCACCLMHNRRTDVYDDFVEELLADVRETLQIADAAGIRKDRILLDPGIGIGFAKSHEDNLKAIGSLDRLCALGYPVLLGASRKSVVGLTLELPPSERLEGSLAAAVIGRLKGASFFRVHDVKEHVRALKMTDAIERYMGA